MGYQIPVFKEYTNSYNSEVHVFHWDHKKLTPYIPEVIENVLYYKRSQFKKYDDLKNIVMRINPDIVYVSGWMDKDYIRLCRILRRKIPVIAGSDTQYQNNLKQKLGIFFFKMFLKRSFEYLWVAGPYQYEYGRKLGFSKDKILFNCLTADIELFNSENKLNIYPKKFLFLGRFITIKGLKVLLKAWNEIQDKNGWSLTFIGNGVLKEDLISDGSVEVIDFMDPKELGPLLSSYGVLILPSVKEPWALVIHEAMAAGLPVIATNVCGAAPVFIINNYNGFMINPNDVGDLVEKINNIIVLSDDKLFEMSTNAKNRSSIITPTIVAASFMSVLNENI